VPTWRIRGRDGRTDLAIVSACLAPLGRQAARSHSRDTTSGPGAMAVSKATVADGSAGPLRAFRSGGSPTLPLRQDRQRGGEVARRRTPAPAVDGLAVQASEVVAAAQSATFRGVSGRGGRIAADGDPAPRRRGRRPACRGRHSRPDPRRTPVRGDAGAGRPVGTGARSALSCRQFSTASSSASMGRSFAPASQAACHAVGSSVARAFGSHSSRRRPAPQASPTPKRRLAVSNAAHS
jgi:hypothetical protein